MKKIKPISLFLCICITFCTIIIAVSSERIYLQSEYDLSQYQSKHYTQGFNYTYDENGDLIDQTDTAQYTSKEPFLRNVYLKVFALLSLGLMIILFAIPHRFTENKVIYWLTHRIRYEVSLLFAIALILFHLHLAPYGIYIFAISNINDISIFSSELWSIAGTLLMFFVTCAASLYTVCALTLLFKQTVHTHNLAAIKENSLLCRNSPYLKQKLVNAIHYLKEINLTEKHEYRLLCQILIHLLIIVLLSKLTDIGIYLAILYCLLLYIFLRNRNIQMKRDFSLLEESIQHMANGNLNEDLNKAMGVYEPLREPLHAIQTNFQEAVEQEVRSQNMKTELITNVSHDLKTPLTSIISYIDLLKKEGLSEEERQSYLLTLEKSSARLKHLIEDLFEVSKANSHNITLNYMQVDIISLLRQVEMECEMLYSEHQLTLRNTFTQDKILLYLDPQKTYRIFENLISNAGKYALANTRVYVEMKESDDAVDIWIKNVSAEEIDFNENEIVERFVRGDKARNSEGSGLGLAIVKSFTELQNGQFSLSLDGDLFKACVHFQKDANKPEEAISG